ncbi:MAG: flagellar basal body protein [Alicyclobacillus sp.]|nr:flagellar basal body protein [Alicyclobacillus sp.]
MIRALTTAASGMVAMERQQQALANNLANAETPGFKAVMSELLAFPEQRLALWDYDSGGPTGSQIGRITTGVAFQEGVPLWTPGTLQTTGRTLDVAIRDSTPAGPYAVVWNGGMGAATTLFPGPVQTTAAQPGVQSPALAAPVPPAPVNPSPGAVQTVAGQVVAGPNGVLEVAGRPLAVLNADGQPLAGVFAARNPAYQGQALAGGDGRPLYDNHGQPSYRWVDAAGNVVGQPGDDAWLGAGLRVGNADDMGWHSFFAVDYAAQPGAGSGGPAWVLTRDGHFALDANNILVDAAGRPVLPIGPSGLPIPGGRIRINPAYQGKDLFQPDGLPVVDSAGNPSYSVIDANGNPVAGRLGVVDADVTQLNPLGAGEFALAGATTAAQALALLRPGSGSVQPGSLEQSNVDASATMTQMLAALAQYEANQRVLRTEDTLLGDAVEQVGKVNA